MAPNDPSMHERVLMAWAEAFPKLDLSLSPPELAGELYGMIPDLTGCTDPFAEYKSRSNREILQALPDLLAMVDANPDPLLTALELSIIGNSLDAGAPGGCSWSEALGHESGSEWAARDYPDFSAAVSRRPHVLILGDNAGEIGLDGLLVRQLQDRDCRVTYAVRGRPILNDATMDDAQFFGLPSLCRVVSSGVDTPGTVLSRCSAEFLEILKSADLVVSKGQGNYEALIGEWPDIHYAFKVKCHVVARLTGQPERSSIFRCI